jgi:hypothetical protein
MLPYRLSAFLLVLTLTPLFTVAQDKPKTKTVRLLTVGNSFSQNATKYLDQIVESDGNKLIHHRCVIGGSGPDQHLAKVAAHAKDPKDKAGLYGTGKSLEEELVAEKWDIITIQQASIRSHDAETYRPGMKNLYEFIKKHAPTSEVVLHETWAYRVDDPRFTKPSDKAGEPKTQKEMYEGLSKSYRTIAKELGVRIIPVGDAFYAADTHAEWGYKPDAKFNAKTATSPDLPDQKNSLHVGWRWNKADGKTALQMDGHHANATGEYLGGLVFYEFLYGRSCVGNKFHPPGVSDDYARFLQDTAHKSVEAVK